MKPRSLRLTCYNVGFGDCFLLSFEYAKTSRHVLIDFGSTALRRGTPEARMLDVARDVALRCQGKLHAVVATHRHKDHISGFATKKNGKGSGDIIAALKPDVVIQPWTEDPKAERDALKPTRGPQDANLSLVAALYHMHGFAEAALGEALRPDSPLLPVARKQIAFLGDDNLSNRSAAVNLQTMGRKNYYVYFGSKSGLEEVLPGVKTEVIGPPTLEQSESIRKQRARDKDEFWQFASFWASAAQAGKVARKNGNLFPRYAAYPRGAAPFEARWFVDRVHASYSEQLLSIVRALDDQMNNTSVILLMEAGGKRLLFPGDAQIENWNFALSNEKVRKRLAAVDLYKVGHHGSLNATPRSLWKLFERRSPKEKDGRLQSVVSTMPGKHGDPRKGTEVPRKLLVEALTQETQYFSTEKLKPSELAKEFTTIF
ncbi:MAG: hypothetical protein ACRD8O_15370 [Bryobacteraceae bacterium]